jgi:hypothetical protein
LKDRLNKEKEFYQLLLSARDKNTTTKLQLAVTKALDRDNSKRKIPMSINYNCEIVQSKLTPELSIVDYLLWALQRYILSGDGRYYLALEQKYNLIIDLYDFERFNGKGESNYYHLKNRFDLEKASEFRRDGYVQK